MTKPTRYLYLFQQLKRHGISLDSLAAALERSLLYVQTRLSGKFPWSSEDRALIMELLREPVINYYRVFPPGGVDRGSSGQAAGRRAVSG